MNYIEPVSRKFLTQYRNGEDFSINPSSDYVGYFQGNVIEKMRLDATYNVYTLTSATDLNKIQIYATGSNYGLKYPSSTWASEGFAVGNTIRLESGALFINTSTIVAIFGDTMIISSASNPLTTFGFSDYEFVSDLTVKNRTIPTGLIFKFGIIPNSDAFNFYNSILDGQVQAYSSNSITSSFSSLNYLSTNSSNLGGIRAKYDSSSGGTSPSSNYIFTFSIEHIFRIPHFISEWLLAYSTDGVPTEFAGLNSYRYTSQLDFSSNILNPNDRKTFRDEFELGSIGFENENFNSGTTNYELQSLIYDTGLAPEVTGTTHVTAQIKRLDSNFSSGVKAILYHSLLPSYVQYSSNGNAYDYNFMLDQILQVEGDAQLDSTYINNFEFSINGSNTSLIDIEFDLIYDATTISRFVNGDYIFLGFAIENNSLSATLSDRVLVRLDAVQVTKDSDVSGLSSNFQAYFQEPESAFVKTNGDLWINRLMTCEFSFDITKFDTGDTNLITNLRYDLVGYDGVNYFSLDTYNFPLGYMPIITVDGCDYQIKNLDTERFLSVPSGSSLREVQLTMSAPTTFEATQEVSGKLGFTIPWQQWKQDLDVPVIFYDGALPSEFFNRNKRTSNYSGEAGYEIYVFLTASLNFNGSNTNYIFYSDAFNVYDFDVDGAGTSWARDSFKIYNSEDEEIEDIDGGGLNRLEWVLSNPTMFGVTEQGILAEIATEPKNNLGREWRLHNVLDWEEDANPLTHEVGETGVKVVVNLIDKIITISCLLDGTKIDNTINHNFYVHLYK